MREDTPDIDPQLVAAVARARHRARAPFGRIGARLGFVWIMPIGTLPLPFHPWFARILPWLITALIAHAMVSHLTGSGEGVRWQALLVTALMLGLVMSIPILNWLAMAFRVPLLQGLAIGGAMVLIAVDVWTGAAPAGMAAVPVLFVALFGVQSIGGPLLVAKMQAGNAAFAAIEPGTRRVMIDDDRVSTNYGSWLIENCDVACVSAWHRTGRNRERKAQTYYRLLPADLAVVRSRVERIRPSGWWVGPNRVLVPEPPVADAEPPIKVKLRPHTTPLWIVTGKRTLMDIDDGTSVRRMISGNAERVGPLPLFTVFYWAAIFGGTSRWVAGFARRKPVMLGTASGYTMLAQAFPKLGERSYHYADAAPLIAQLDALDADQRAPAQALLDCLLSGNRDIPTNCAPLLRRSDIAFGQGEALCARLAAAKSATQDDAVRLSAQLIAMLPPEEFAALSGTLLVLLNSRELAFRLLGGNSPEVLALPEEERRKHVIGGFSLVRRVPQLYERLGELGQPALPLITGLGELGRWPAPLRAAYTQITGQPIGDIATP